MRISWTDKRTNLSIREQLGHNEGTWLIDTIMKIIYIGVIEGKKGRGRSRKRCSQDITHRLNTTITEARRQAQDRTAYRRATLMLHARENLPQRRRKICPHGLEK